MFKTRKKSNALARKIRKGIATPAEVQEFERLDALESGKVIQPKAQALYDLPIFGVMWALDARSIES